MESYDVPAKGYFWKNYNELLAFFGYVENWQQKKDILSMSKEEFLNAHSMFKEAKYLLYKDLEETFAKRETLSYFEFSALLNKNYGLYLDKIKENNKNKLSDNINTIKNILVFFTVIWVIGVIVYIISLLV